MEVPTVLPIGTFAGAPILVRVEVLVVYPLFMLALVLRDPFAAAVLLPVLAASILAHECGHAYAAAREGLAVERIELTAFGGLCTYEDPGSDVRRQFIVAAAGPMANFALALALVPLAYGLDGTGRWGRLAGDALVMNASLGLINLLPALPLDGGRIAFILIAQARSQEAAMLVVSTLGLVLSAPLLIILFVFAFSGFPVVLPILWWWNWPLFKAAWARHLGDRRDRKRRRDWDTRARPKRGPWS